MRGQRYSSFYKARTVSWHRSRLYGRHGRSFVCNFECLQGRSMSHGAEAHSREATRPLRTTPCQRSGFGFRAEMSSRGCREPRRETRTWKRAGSLRLSWPLSWLGSYRAAKRQRIRGQRRNKTLTRVSRYLPTDKRKTKASALQPVKTLTGKERSMRK